MQNSTAFKFAPVFSDDKKVDVSLENGEAVMRLSTWEEGLGWCGQKTMALDAAMLDELHRVVSAARLKLKREAVENGEEIIPAKVLEFPRFT